ncbi:MAG TPA: type-F conjugative transfer system pilin assembly protein TrbC [Geobacteraceae bacterium]
MRRLRAQLIVFMLLATPLAASAAVKQGYVETPDACYVPEKVEGETVSLKAVGACNGKPGRAFVRTEWEKLKVFVEGKFWKEVPVEEMTVSDLSASLSKAGELAGTLTVPRNSAEEEMRGAADKLYSYYRSDAFQGRLRSETERIRSQAFGESFARFYPDTVAGEGKGRLGKSERVYLFLSSSMPLETVRNYAASVSRLRDPRVIMVMRGFVGGMTKIQPTIDFVSNVLKEDPSCAFADTECRMRPANLVVDPLLFRRYGIDRVPAVVYVRGIRSVDEALSEGDMKNTSVTDNYTVFGDASLDYVLEMIARESGFSSLRDLVARKD